MSWFSRARKLEDMTEKELLIQINRQLSAIMWSILMVLVIFISWSVSTI